MKTNQQQIKQAYEQYKNAHSYKNDPQRALLSLLHFYGDYITYAQFQEFSLNVNQIKTFEDADKLADVIISKMTHRRLV